MYKVELIGFFFAVFYWPVKKKKKSTKSKVLGTGLHLQPVGPAFSVRKAFLKKVLRIKKKVLQYLLVLKAVPFSIALFAVNAYFFLKGTKRYWRYFL